MEGLLNGIFNYAILNFINDSSNPRQTLKTKRVPIIIEMVLKTKTLLD